MPAIQTVGLSFFAVYKTGGFARLEGEDHATLRAVIADHPNAPKRRRYRRRQARQGAVHHDGRVGSTSAVAVGSAATR